MDSRRPAERLELRTVKFREPFVSRHPWTTACLLASAATPAGVVLGWLAPRPLDAVVALPLVLLDVWAARRGSASEWHRLGLIALGIALTWLLYVVAARLILSRLFRRDYPAGS